MVVLFLSVEWEGTDNCVWSDSLSYYGYTHWAPSDIICTQGRPRLVTLTSKNSPWFHTQKPLSRWYYMQGKPKSPTTAFAPLLYTRVKYPYAQYYCSRLQVMVSSLWKHGNSELSLLLLQHCKQIPWAMHSVCAVSMILSYCVHQHSFMVSVYDRLRVRDAMW